MFAVLLFVNNNNNKRNQFTEQFQLESHKMNFIYDFYDDFLI